jgi:HEAT repeat protein
VPAIGSFSRFLALLAAIVFALPVTAMADDIGWPYRGPKELTGGSDTEGEDPGTGGGEEEGGDDGGDDSGTPGGDSSGTTPSTSVKGPGAKAASVDGPILWSWWWEHNKDRFLARATERGKVNAGSIAYWFGAGAKYPPRDINPVSDAQRHRIYVSLVKRLGDNSVGVRSAACIALGRLKFIEADEKEKQASAADDKVTDNMCARSLLEVVRKTKDAEVRASALLGLGMTGDAKACQALLRMYDKEIPTESKGFALIAFGLARSPDAIGLLVETLPKSATESAKFETEIASVHALGLYGPAFVEEIRKHKSADGSEDGITRLEHLASKSSRAEAVRVQAITALGRLQTELGTVKKDSTNKSLAVRWAAILALAEYSSDEDAARDAAKQLTTKAYKGDQQTKNFCILAAGDLAGRLDGNSKARAETLEWLRGKKQLDGNDNYARACSALALGLANDQTAVPAIADLLESTTIDDYVAGACSVALGLLKAADHADQILKRVVKSSFKPDAKGYGLVGLALMGDTTRVDEITDMTRGTPQREIDRQAPLALGVLGDRRHSRALTGYFKTKPKTNRQVPVSNAVFGLAWIRDGSSVDELLKLADSGPDPEVRGLATIALGYIGSPERVSALTRCFENTTFRNRFAGWTVLYEISNIL